jgi:glycosyltransferase involved in cell wall biosynthesis
LAKAPRHARVSASDISRFTRVTQTPGLISIILPVHNQADHIEPLIREFVSELGKVPAPYELTLVENASRDSSLEVCRRLAAELPRVKVITSERGGWGHAVRLGLQAAEGDVICYTNSARTTAQDLVSCLLYALANGGVVVKANRKIRENWRRRLGSLLFNIECRALFDLSNWDVNGTPKVFPRSFGQLLHLQLESDLIDTEFCIRCRQNGYPMIEVPVFSTRRHGGKSTSRYASAARLYWGAIALWGKREWLSRPAS